MLSYYNVHNIYLIIKIKIVINIPTLTVTDVPIITDHTKLHGQKQQCVTSEFMDSDYNDYSLKSFHCCSV